MPPVPKLDKDTEKKLETFRTAVSAEADDVIFRLFPSKILELQQLIESTSSPSSPFHISHAATTDTTIYPPPPTSDEPDVKKRKLDLDGRAAGNGVNDTRYARFPNLVLANKHLAPVDEAVKRECEQLAELCDKVKLWINLTMPKIEDGDNFGVQIQEEVLNELHRSQESAYNLRDNARQGHLNRAKICSKIIKYPNVEDYSIALKEHDEKQLYIARQNLFDIRNIYAVMTDVLHKNMTKLRAPKGNNAVGLY
ncbi:proteasome activator pa28, REG alpha/beta subunit [Dentipellis sp. KUC8613]|nr:proteasome activator pa28, REG alpha/beta subunit [Dentipellis sp. KUC8613]